MARVHCKRDAQWLEMTLSALRGEGYCIVEGVLSDAMLEEIRPAMYRAQAAIAEEVGKERLRAAGELGVMRLMLKFEPVFFRLLEIPELLAVVDATVSPTAVMHLQNGFILPSFRPGETPKVFQNSYHMDFPRVLNGYLASINAFFAVDAFSAENGGTLVLPGYKQNPVPPSAAHVEGAALQVECEPGAMLVFDSTLYHASGSNVSGKDRLGINHQFTRSYIKQQIDYVRALGNEAVLAREPRTQQLLGWYTRVVTSLDEYYQPEAKRLYRRGQG
jgi:ectoine hydroxylase-related dioxygenase (phytanoyl-CoA dioxygenase family)